MDHGGSPSCVDEIVNSLYEDMLKMEESSVDASLRSSQSCIFKVPDAVSRDHEKAYSPIVFSIGPFHHAKQHLKATERIKKKYMADFIEINEVYSRKLLQGFVKAIEEVKNKARECYAGGIDMKDDEFIRVLVLDGCFILELFCKRAFNLSGPRDDTDHDPIFDTNFMLEFLYHDLILVDNQIPWLVLESLFDLKDDERNETEVSLRQLAIGFFDNIFSPTPPSIRKILSNSSASDHQRRDEFHILDVLRNSLLILLPPRVRKYEQRQILPSATNLQVAGIKLQVPTKSKCILDITFKDGVLEIPPLLVQPNVTETLFRNLIAFEQNSLFHGSKFTSYAAFLESLIQTSSDLKLLCKIGIIETSMNIEDATQCFRKLIHGTYDNIEEYLYLDVIVEVNKSCKRRWTKYLRVLKLDECFKTP